MKLLEQGLWPNGDWPRVTSLNVGCRRVGGSPHGGTVPPTARFARIFGWLIAALIIATPATAAHKLVPANIPIAVAKSGLTVTPPAEWNEVPYGSGKRSESWTLDGLNLNELEFFAAVEDGKPLVREIDKRDRPMPRFSANMLAPDIVGLYETTLRSVSQTAFYSTETIEPAIFAGTQGFRFAFNYTLQDEVRRKGEGIGAVIGGKLYLVVFTAAATHYFDRDVEQFRKIAASARVSIINQGP